MVKILYQSGAMNFLTLNNKKLAKLMLGSFITK